jgi:hypothetical protein
MPVGDKVLNAMAQAFPDPVDAYLLSMVMGCDRSAIDAAIQSLVDAGLAHARIVREGTQDKLEAPSITAIGMLVAEGAARDAAQATAMLGHLEAETLRQLLAHRIDKMRRSATHLI